MFNEKEIVENLLKRNDLTDWDKDFMLSISERFNSGKDLTEKQIEWVHKIASRYSEEAVKERQDWASQWNGGCVAIVRSIEDALKLIGVK